MQKNFLVTFHLTSGQIQQMIREQSLAILQNRLENAISNKGVTFLNIDGTIIFTRHIKNFTIVKTK
ncbi:hypothetical protein P4V05_20655 [Bacillus thuringiensis]|uniref:hypothetical protein n=1 Tax=Bacillus wiedmannii TaxID=1890302 RepID=UPI000BF146AE|nr:hypothetical protein [Bacillus wiedmannii]MED1902534.1 hypothetical protein [Bacillus thuringiensis]PEL44842.1 hypothetical protein CN607_03785 [Bacillus wiedmannii]